MTKPPDEQASEAPATELRSCRTCGALEIDGKPHADPCTCENPAWEALVPLPVDMPTKDPKTGQRNIYAERVLARLGADIDYLRTLAVTDGETAAYMTCEKHGHEARAGMCSRCGGRVARMAEE